MAEISEISSRYVDEYAQLDPVRAIRSMGVVPGETLTDYSPAGFDALEQLYRRTSASLRAAEPVDEAERLGRLFLLDQVEGELALLDAGEREGMVSAIVGPPAAVRLAFDLVPRRNEDEWTRVAALLADVRRAMEGYRATLESGVERGHVGQRRIVSAVAEQCTTWAEGWFERYVGEYGDGPLHARLSAVARDAAAAYGELASWLRADYLASAATDDGVGEDRYRVWSRFMLGTEIDLDDAYAWGWEELARIEREQIVECDRIRPGASFEEVRTLLDTDPARAVHSVDEYRQWLQDISDEATATLNDWQFDIPEPLLRCEIGIPPEGSAAAAYYTPPSEDLTQPGRTWFPTVGRTTIPKWDQVTIAYHEAVPGHHLQLGMTRLVPLTRAHKLGFQVAHGEGWALYAERLMDELGQFTIPDTRLGFLASQAFRATRVVVDIGLHTGRPLPDGTAWTFELAKEHLRRSSGLTEEFADSEVKRYISWPAQAPTYKLGERAWLAGRDAARATQGASFDLKRWHAGALALGALGLRDLERELATAGSA
jgi:uncharacterized protein (DUF885 family)